MPETASKLLAPVLLEGWRCPSCALGKHTPAAWVWQCWRNSTIPLLKAPSLSMTKGRKRRPNRWQAESYLLFVPFPGFFFAIRARRFLFVFLVQRTHWFQPLARKKKKKKFQRKCAPLDKFAWTSTALNSRRERDRLLDANNSNMETDGEGKFVSFKVVLGGTSLFKMNHGPAGLECRVCRFYWSTGASWGTHHGGFSDKPPRRSP